MIPEPYHGGGYDILNAIEDAGGIRPRPAGYRDSLYDDMPELAGVYVRIMRRGSTIAPDQMAAILHRDGLGDGYTTTMWSLIHQAIQGRRRHLHHLAIGRAEPIPC